MKEIYEIVLSYPKLKDRVRGKIEEQEKVIKIVDEIKAQFSEKVARLLVHFIDTTFIHLYEGINIDTVVDYDLEKLVSNNHVVLVPNHQSHADYVALNYIIYKKFKFPVFVAGGINLNIPLLGTLFRWCGCFFIRRSFGSDILYKLTLEAYLYFLLYKGYPIEFFFEGGRSRSGKLMSPRYGLYQMLLEAHDALSSDHQKPLKFIPVSIVHEYVPETSSLARELDGAKKHKESFFRLFKIFKIFAYRMGSVHIRLGQPVDPPHLENSKKNIQTLAFNCFREVGNNILVTPSSLLALIMLDEPTGALKWDEIFAKAKSIVHYCEVFNIPIVDTLREAKLERTLEDSIDLFLNNKKFDVIGEENLGHVFYAVNVNCRKEMLYFKNSILHHFLTPWILNIAWINLFNGSITDVSGLRRFLLSQRKHMKYEFYLPTVKEFVLEAKALIEWCTGKALTSYDEVLTLSARDFYNVIMKIGIFSKSMMYIHEAYYISALTIKALHTEMAEFKLEDYWKKSKEVYSWQRGINRVITFSESFSMPVMKNSMQYFTHQKYLIMENGVYHIKDTEAFDTMLLSWENLLLDQLSFNIRGV
ncbi:MAG: hypothetical protein A2202_07165 [Bdellovibrionales bacterium RIFOXYA1_FULL_36_14]|nr:MAG: hypothetical protein A2202_07165 [Bdellovibrionales bacterium RIFOXYA1_FULL_36_14]